MQFLAYFFNPLSSRHENFCQILEWYFDTKIVLTYCDKILFSDGEKNFLNFEVTRTISLISERSEQFWYQNTKV